MKTYKMKITSAIAVGGEIVRAGTVLNDVPEQDARRLLARGKAELATEDDVNAEADADEAEAADAKPKGKAKAAAKVEGGAE